MTQCPNWILPPGASLVLAGLEFGTFTPYVKEPAFVPQTELRRGKQAFIQMLAGKICFLPRA
jgi:hypothetical protein